MTLGYEMVAEVLEVAPDVTEVAVGDLVHTGTPHQEETVLDLDASLRATYPLVRLRPPSAPSGPCSSAWPRSPSRPSTTPR